MPHSLIKYDTLFNRLIINEMKNIDCIDPDKILDNIFKEVNPGELTEDFNSFCIAALSEKYAWKEGNPGNLLYLSELLEQTLEASFLIYHKRAKDDNNVAGLIVQDQCFEALNILFTGISLLEWKIALHHWTMAGLSDHSVIENVSPSDILPFVRGVEKLIETAYQITQVRI